MIDGASFRSMQEELQRDAEDATPPVALLWHGLPASLVGQVADGGPPRRQHVYPSLGDALAAAGTPAPPVQLLRTYLPPDPITSPVAARLAVGDACFAWGRPELVPHARRIISELVTNAAQHARTEIQLTAAGRGPFLYLAVRDGEPTRPRPVPLRPFDPSTARGAQRALAIGGYGLRIVAALSVRWGSTVTWYGKIVWALVGQQEPAPARAGDVPRPARSRGRRLSG